MHAALGRALPCTRSCADGAKGAGPFGIPFVACGRDGGWGLRVGLLRRACNGLIVEEFWSGYLNE